MSEPPEKTIPSSRSSVSPTPSSLGGPSSGRPPARSTERTYESGISAAGSVHAPHVASSAYAVIPMIGRKLLRFSPIAVVLVAAACGGGGGGGGTQIEAVPPSTTTPQPDVRGYFPPDGKGQPGAPEAPEKEVR